MEPKVSGPRKAEIVYYLSREGQLEQPHLLDVPICSAQGLYLRDVKKRLILIHGKTMPSAFSWSYKRNYKTGFVWQDLCDDDLVLPANGCEYVLKGSRIVDPFRNRSVMPGVQDTTHGSCHMQPFASYSHQLERSAERREFEDSYSVTTFPESQKSDITFEFDQVDAARTEYGAQAESQIKEEGNSSKSHSGNTANRKEEGSESKIEYKVYTKPACGGLIETGADAATQTEEQERLQLKASSKCDQDWDRENSGENSRGSEDSQDKLPTELEKGEISPPPYSSCSGSSSASGKLDGERSAVSCFDKEDEEVHDQQPSNASVQAELKPKNHDERVEIIEPAIHQEFARKARITSNMETREELLRPNPKIKTSSSTSSGFLQFVSCGGGGLEVKAEAMAMPIYVKNHQIKQPSSTQGTVDKIFDLVRLGHSRKKSWQKGGSCKKVIRLPTFSINNHNHNEPEILSPANAVAVDLELSGRREGYCDKLGVALPDTMSRNMQQFQDNQSTTNESSCIKMSRDQVVNHQFKRRSTDKRSFPVFGSDKLFIEHGQSQESSSELIRASSMTPRLSRNQTIDFRDQLQQMAINSERLEAASEEKSIISKLGNRKANSYREQIMTRTHQQDVPLLWEELLVTTKKIFTNRDERPLPPYGSKAEWEKRIQFAADMALPPPDFNLSLQQCSQCGRKFAPESLKLHRRSCKGDKRSKSSRTFTLSSSQKPTQLMF